MKIKNSRIPKDILVGSVYETKCNGKLTVVEYINSLEIKVKFIKTGYECTVQIKELRTGKIKDRLRPSVFSVGYMGEGEYKRNHPSYVKWHSMIRRCYSPLYLNRRHTYIDVMVCEKWHNFQNFAKWYSENYPTDGSDYELDKDLLSPYDKGILYSESTCTFLSQKENSKLKYTKIYKFINPEGNLIETSNVTELAKSHGLCVSGLSLLHSGIKPQYRGWTKYKENI